MTEKYVKDLMDVLQNRIEQFDTTAAFYPPMNLYETAVEYHSEHNKSSLTDPTALALAAVAKSTFVNIVENVNNNPKFDDPVFRRALEEEFLKILTETGLQSENNTHKILLFKELAQYDVGDFITATKWVLASTVLANLRNGHYQLYNSLEKSSSSIPDIPYIEVPDIKAPDIKAVRRRHETAPRRRNRPDVAHSSIPDIEDLYNSIPEGGSLVKPFQSSTSAMTTELEFNPTGLDTAIPAMFDTNPNIYADFDPAIAVVWSKYAHGLDRKREEFITTMSACILNPAFDDQSRSRMLSIIEESFQNDVVKNNHNHLDLGCDTVTVLYRQLEKDNDMLKQASRAPDPTEAEVAAQLAIEGSLTRITSSLLNMNKIPLGEDMKDKVNTLQQEISSTFLMNTSSRNAMRDDTETTNALNVLRKRKVFHKSTPDSIEESIAALKYTSEERAQLRRNRTYLFDTTEGEQFKEISRQFNFPAKKLDVTNPKKEGYAYRCWEDRADGTQLNVYGCDSSKSEVCHASMCSSVQKIIWQHLVCFLKGSNSCTITNESTDEEKSMFGDLADWIFGDNGTREWKKEYGGTINDTRQELSYVYMQNSPTLNNLLAQIIHLAFTPPQLLFIIDYMQRYYQPGTAGLDTKLPEISSRRETPLKVPAILSKGPLLIQEGTMTGMADDGRMRYSLWMSPYHDMTSDDYTAESLESHTDKYTMEHAITTMRAYIKKTYGEEFDTHEICDPKTGARLILQHVKSGEPYRLTYAQSLMVKYGVWLYFREIKAVSTLKPYEMCGTRFVRDLVDVMGTYACTDLFFRICDEYRNTLVNVDDELIVRAAIIKAKRSVHDLSLDDGAIQKILQTQRPSGTTAAMILKDASCILENICEKGTMEGRFKGAVNATGEALGAFVSSHFRAVAGGAYLMRTLIDAYYGDATDPDKEFYNKICETSESASVDMTHHADRMERCNFYKIPPSGLVQQRLLFNDVLNLFRLADDEHITGKSTMSTSTKSFLLQMRNDIKNNEGSLEVRMLLAMAKFSMILDHTLGDQLKISIEETIEECKNDDEAGIDIPGCVAEKYATVMAEFGNLWEANYHKLAASLLPGSNTAEGADGLLKKVMNPDLPEEKVMNDDDDAVYDKMHTLYTLEENIKNKFVTISGRKVKDDRSHASLDHANIFGALKGGFALWSESVIEDMDSHMYDAEGTRCNRSVIKNITDSKGSMPGPFVKPSYLYMPDASATLVGETIYFCPSNYEASFGEGGTSGGACCIPSGGGDDTQRAPALPALWLDIDHFGNTDIYGMYQWKKRSRWMDMCSKEIVADEAEVTCLAQNLVGFQDKLKDEEKARVVGQLTQHWEKSHAEYIHAYNQISWKDTKGTGVTAIMNFIQNIHATAGAAMEYHIRNTLGTFVGTDARQQAMYQDAFNVWGQERDDRDIGITAKVRDRVWYSVWGKVSNARDAIFNIIMLVLRSPAMFEPLVELLDQLKHYMCGKMNKGLSKFFKAFREPVAGPDVDYREQRDSDWMELSRSLMAQLGGEDFVNSFYNKVKLAVDTTSSAMLFIMGPVMSVGPTLQTWLSGTVCKAILRSVDTAINNNVQHMQMKWGMERLYAMFTSPCLQAIHIAGVRVFRQGKSDGIFSTEREMYWSKEARAEDAARAQDNQEKFYQRTIEKATKNGAVAGWFGGNEWAGATAGAAYGSYKTFKYRDGTVGDRMDIQTLVTEIMKGNVKMFEFETIKEYEVKTLKDRNIDLVLWSLYKARTGNVQCSQGFFLKFLREDLSRRLRRWQDTIADTGEVDMEYSVIKSTNVLLKKLHQDPDNFDMFVRSVIDKMNDIQQALLQEHENAQKVADDRWMTMITDNHVQ